MIHVLAQRQEMARGDGCGQDTCATAGNSKPHVSTHVHEWLTQRCWRTLLQDAGRARSSRPIVKFRSGLAIHAEMKHFDPFPASCEAGLGTSFKLV